MKRMVIRVYSEKVDHTRKDVRGWGKVLKGQYELTSTVSYPNQGGWKTWEEFAKKNRKRGTFDGDKARFPLGTHHGIDSYQEITFEGDK